MEVAPGVRYEPDKSDKVDDNNGEDTKTLASPSSNKKEESDDDDGSYGGLRDFVPQPPAVILCPTATVKRGGSKNGKDIIGRIDDADNGDAHLQKLKKLVPAATGTAKMGNKAQNEIPRPGLVNKALAGQNRIRSKKATRTAKPRYDKSKTTTQGTAPRKSKRPAPVVTN